MNMFLQDKYKEESDNVKNEVKKHQAAMKEEGQGDKDEMEADEKNQAYQK
jgi:hypothetical protein